MSKYKGAICRGCWSLGTACGKCEKCIDTKPNTDQSNDYHFFWSGPFSNWHIADFKYQGRTFNCVEQYMMSYKAALFSDIDSFNMIMQASEPRKQKKLGRMVKNFEVKKWNFFSHQIVLTGCLCKFTQNKNLKKELLKLQNKRLVEASPFDRIWGIGYKEEDALKNIDNWGENRLGNILNEIKQILR